MSLTPITDAVAMRSAFDRLTEQWTAGAQVVRRLVGWPGGSEVHDVYWRAGEGVWAFFMPYPNRPRYWCAYGTDDPQRTNDLNIACEINPPQVGQDRRCRGVFAEDAHGAVYYLHSGGLGGGRPGIGQEAFRTFYRHGERETVEWADRLRTPYFVVARLDSPTLPADLARYVQAAAQFKQTVAGRGN